MTFFRSSSTRLSRLGKAIKTARKVRGLTQKSVADATGLTKEVIADMECGAATARLMNWITVTDYLGVLGFGFDSGVVGALEVEHQPVIETTTVLPPTPVRSTLGSPSGSLKTRRTAAARSSR